MTKTDTTTAPAFRLHLAVVDPVCRTDVQRAILNGQLPHAVTLFHGDTLLLFCSDLCRRHYEMHPRKFSRGSDNP